MLSRVILPLLLTLATQQPTTQPNWEQDLKVRHLALIEQNGPGTDSVLRDQLLAMKKTDQEARGLMLNPTPHPNNNGSQVRLATNLQETDLSLTEQMKQIAESRGWPTIRLVGVEASNAAMLILTHSPDHEWQAQILPQLEQLADGGRIDGAPLALVIDKELTSEGKLQRYGSQFKLVNGTMAMFAVEDPANLDRRRAQVFLPPMDVYKASLTELYHLKVSNQIVSATPPQQP